MDARVSTPTDTDILLRTDASGVATLTLNLPTQYNVLSKAMLARLQAELDGIAKDKSVRVVVIAGNGKAFCAGHDLKEMRSHTDKAFQKDLFDRCSTLMMALVHLPQPVIAKVNGIATAAGCQLVAACDLAVASSTSRFAVSGITVGLFCGTPSVALSRNMLRKQAMEMLLTGEFIDAPTALARGLVNRVVPADQLDAELAKLIASITNKSAAALSAGKALFYKQLEAGLSGAYEQASEFMACSMMTYDAGEGIDAFVQKRTPRWEDR
ncbi:MAG: enoyl-CoA hydratase [Burkholderiaceae bacterium]|nr:MAG: enoyl-CoA hydratase [Burkholderiaceae bacterium]